VTAEVLGLCAGTVLVLLGVGCLAWLAGRR